MKNCCNCCDRNRKQKLLNLIANKRGGKFYFMNYVEIYKSVLNYHRKYSQVRNDDSYWQEVFESAHAIETEFDNSKFVTDMLVAVINELERKSRQQDKGG